MDTKRILYVSQEIHPYLPENEISKPSLELPKKMNSRSHQVRVFMPRYGLINERRHQLHEVIRLSGINIIVNDMDQPLIIKVASVPQARMQVYFIDNEEYFKRKAIFYDDDDVFHTDNDQRAIFFCRGVVETVKKLGWSPDIIHCHGWMASFLPAYLKRYYADDPLFADSKTVLSIYGAPDEKLGDSLADNLKFDGFNEDDLKLYENTHLNSIYKAGVHYVDGVLCGSDKVDEEVKKYAQEHAANFADVSASENLVDDVNKLYEQITIEEESVA
jgi:starch synthase